MREALQQAKRARSLNEVPVGAVLVRDGQLVAAACNGPIGHHDPSAHAEIQVLRKAGEVLNNYRLPGTTLYVTLEPCTMCAGAIIHARIERLVFGAYDPRTGAIESVNKVLDQPFHNHKVSYSGGVLAEECGQLLSDFFRQRR